MAAQDLPRPATIVYSVPLRSIGVAYVLWAFGGWFGFHKFYLARPGWGVLYAFTMGLLLIGWIYDLFTLPRQVKETNLTTINDGGLG